MLKRSNSLSKLLKYWGIEQKKQELEKEQENNGNKTPEQQDFWEAEVNYQTANETKPQGGIMLKIGHHL